MYEITEQERKMWEECYRNLAEAQKQVAIQNRKVLKEAYSLRSKSFKKYLKRVIKECEIGGYNSCYFPFEIVNTPRGHYQIELGFGSITGYYVDQRATGMEGDSFAGTITVILSKGKYLQMPYEC